MLLLTLKVVRTTFCFSLSHIYNVSFLFVHWDSFLNCTWLDIWLNLSVFSILQFLINEIWWAQNCFTTYIENDKIIRIDLFLVSTLVSSNTWFHLSFINQLYKAWLIEINFCYKNYFAWIKKICKNITENLRNKAPSDLYSTQTIPNHWKF